MQPNPQATQSTETAMERIWFHIDHRICHFWMRHSSVRLRRLFEHFLLLIAILSFGLLIIMHKSFVFRTGHTNCASTCLSNVNVQADVIHLVVGYHNQSSASLAQDEAGACFPSKEIVSSMSDRMSIEYSYSRKKAYMLLEPNDPLLHQLDIKYVIVRPKDLNCFGDGALQFLIEKFGVGWDTILLNWLLVFNQRNQTSFVYQPRTQRLFELPALSPPPSALGYYGSVSLNKLGVLIQTSFLFFFCTALVSFTLNETQERMLEFTQELSRRVGHNLPLLNLVTSHVLNSLIFCPLMVGMISFLIEFYKGDKFLGFLVFSLVWCVEVYTVISLRSWQGITYFPRIFFLLFSLFHIYYFANPTLGFSYIAFFVVVLFSVHSMMFFWHRFELPAIAFGFINIQRPRAPIQALPPVLQTPPRVQRTNRTTVATEQTERDDTGSELSFLATAESSSNRNSHLFQPGNIGNDDDDDESFSYYMEGESILQRNRQVAPLNQDSSDNGRDTDSMDTSLDNEHVRLDSESPEKEDRHQTQQINAVLKSIRQPQSRLEPSSGAILDVRLAPRHQNSQLARKRSGLTSSEPPPAFPDLPS